MTSDFDLDPGGNHATEAAEVPGEVAPVSVGSAGGATTVAGYDVEVLGDYDLAQIGYHGAGGGAINVLATHDVILSAYDGYLAQLGNGGTNAAGDVTGDISVQAGNQIQLLAHTSGTVWLGNTTLASGHIETGDVTIVAGSQISGIDAMVLADLGDNPDGTYISGAGGNVTVGFTGLPGDLSFQSDYFDSYNSPHALSILSTTGIDVTSSIQNSGTGNINIVAGWDGTTTNPAQFKNSGVYGNNGGSVYVTSDYDLDPNEAYGSESEEGEAGTVAVGSAGGTTTVAGYNVEVLGYFGNSQIGYLGAGSGAIDVLAANDVVLYAQNGFNAAIANGSKDTYGDVSGNITVTAGGDVSFDGGNGDTGGVAYIGNVGATDESATPFTVSGDISVNADGSITLTATPGGEDVGQAWIGNTAYGSAGTANGNIALAAGTDITLYSDGDGAFTQIGNYAEADLVSGDLTLKAGGDVTLTADGSGDTALIGNLLYNPESDTTSASGNIVIEAAGQLGLYSYNGSSPWIGNTAAVETGNLTIIAGSEDDNGVVDLGDIVLANLGDDPGGAYIDGAGGNVTIGFTGSADNLTINKGFEYDSPHTLSLLSATGVNITSSLLNDGTGAINFVAGWNPAVVTADQVVTATNGAAGDMAALFAGNAAGYGLSGGNVMIGGASAAGDASVGSAGGTTTVFTSNLTIEADNGIAQLGYHGDGGGNITVFAKDTVTLDGASAADMAEIGNGSVPAPGSGAITLAAQALSVNAYNAIFGDTAAIAIAGSGDVGSIAAPLQLWLNAFSITTGGGDVFASSPDGGISIGVDGTGVDLDGGSFTLSADGAISQTEAILADALDVSSTGGSITLDDTGNAFNTLTVSTTASYGASIYDHSAVTVASADVGGTFTLTSDGSIGQSGAITANALDVSSNGGAITLDDTGNAFNTLTVATTAATTQTSMNSTQRDRRLGHCRRHLHSDLGRLHRPKRSPSSPMRSSSPLQAARSRSTTPATPSTR